MSRKVISVSGHFYDFCKNVSKNFDMSMSDFLDILAKNNVEDLTNTLQVSVENLTNTLQNILIACREFKGNSTNALQDKNAKNAIFSPKTQILNKKDCYPCALFEGGKGGVTLNNDVTCVPVVQSNIKNVTEKREHLPANEYWQKIENDFLPYWVAIPNCMRLQDYEICKKIYNKIKKRICKPYFFCGAMKFFWDTDWEFKQDKGWRLPTPRQIFENEVWKGLGKKVEDRIEANKKNYEDILASRVAEFKGGDL